MYVSKKYRLDANSMKFFLLTFPEAKQRKFIDLAYYAKQTSDFSELRRFLIMNRIIKEDPQIIIEGLIQDMTVHLIGAFHNLNIQSRNNINLKQFVSAFVDTVKDNLETKCNNVTLVDQFLIIYESNLSWREKMISYFSALQIRNLIAEYVVKDIEKHLT